MNGFKNIGYAVALVAVPLVLATSTQAVALECKTTYTQASGSGGTKAIAKSRATKAWSDKVKSTYGHISWSVWKTATAKSINCSENGGDHTCVAKAKPCKYVVF